MGRNVICKAARTIVESLEIRQLMHGGLSALINFQSADDPVPDGYVADSGAVYADRGNTLTYGWDQDNSGNLIARHSPAAPDARYDTFAQMQSGGGSTWEMAVQNGDYLVHVVAGDAADTNSNFKIDVEGIRTVDGAPTAADPWVEGTRTVTVLDGKLTISNGDGALNNKICYVDISATHDPAIIAISASVPTIDEDGMQHGLFKLTRTGSPTLPAEVDYTIGGSATGGDDYDTLSGTATFAAFSDTAYVDVISHPDHSPEGNETVMLTVNQSVNYQIDPTQSDATVTIADDDVFMARASSFIQRVNFQPDGTDVPDYYKADTGAAYGMRKNGMTYGWNGKNSGNTRDRNAANSPDQRYDTFAHMQKAGDWKWEMAVPNGTYTVRVVSGDATAIDSVFRINVEGALTVNGTPTRTNPWVEGTSTVTVSDGQLTISNAAGASNNKIDFVEIASGSSPIPVVKLAATAPSISENDGSGTKGFTVTRSGDLSKTLTVNYTITGSATNGVDYQTLSGAVAFSAGSATAMISVLPINDTDAEGDENISIKLSTSGAYSLGQKFSAGLLIADDDINSTALGSLNWSTAKASPQQRAEATGLAIGGKLYAFGGYKDSTYRPIARVDQFDPATNTWTQKADMPFAATHMGTTTDGSYGYFAGGYPGDATKGQTFSTVSVRRYDPVHDKWTNLKDLPSARGAGNMQYLNGKLYFFGGADFSRKDRAEMFSLDLNNPAAGWVQLASMPQARNHVGGAVLNGQIYAIGGQQFQDQNSQFKGDVYRYDPASNKWTTVAGLINQPRSHINGSTVVYNGHIIAMGGEGPGRVALRNVEAYDPASNKWTSLDPLPAGRSSGIGVVINGKLIFNGGYSGQFNSQTWIGTFS